MTTTMTDTLTTVADATLKLCEVLEAGYIRWSPDSKFPPKYTISAGKKYLKIVQSSTGNDRSVHAFVDKITGQVYKAATWQAPAKGARYNLLESPEACYEAAGKPLAWAGNYLYRQPY